MIMGTSPFRISAALLCLLTACYMSTCSSLRTSPKSFSFTKPEQMTQALKGFMLSGLVAVSMPMPTMAVGLGEHTTCAYPACTTQEEILKANAPGLAGEAERDGYVKDLKDMDFILSNAFSAMLEQKDYESMRSGLRQAPMMNLRLTVRKYKDFLEEPEKKLFMSKYSKMIEDLDDTDVLVFKRLQGSSSDKDVQSKLEKTIQDFKDMMAVIPSSPASTPPSPVTPGV